MVVESAGLSRVESAYELFNKSQVERVSTNLLEGKPAAKAAFRFYFCTHIILYVCTYMLTYHITPAARAP